MSESQLSSIMAFESSALKKHRFCRLHSVMGNIQAKLNNSTESLAYYNRARNDPIDVSNKNSNIAGWKSFIDFKLAEHLIIGKSCKEAQ